MDALETAGPVPACMGKARKWLAERARLRRDARVVARMDASELRDLGFSHTASVQSGILLTECGPVAYRSWIHAEPCFPRRDLRRN